jgi:hypothetical protein
MVTLPVRVLQYGIDEPLPERHTLHAGPLTMVLEQGTLRSIKLGTREIVRSIYAAVRDRNWGTIEPRFLSYEVESQEDSFRVHFVAQHANAEVDFTWQGTIIGEQDGTLRFTFDGFAQHNFLKNRIGFCVLHPMELAGTPIEVETPQGIEKAVFPQRISPQQPFKDIVALRFPALLQEETEYVEMRFEGDLFEMEDQRNWTDASYKTYCTPLRLPYPVEIAENERVYQSITLHVPSTTPSVVASSSKQVQLRVLNQAAGYLPALGFGVASHVQSLSQEELERLLVLRPSYLWVEINLKHENWQALLLQAFDEARALHAELELSVLCDDEGDTLAFLIELIATRHIFIARLFLYPSSTFVTTDKLVSRAHTLLQAASISTQLGCGSRANFAEFNRAALPLSHIEVAGYAINPQVHTFDNTSLIETLAAQAVSVTNAKELTGSLPLSIGPITLKPRFNAAATATSTDEQQEDVLPATVDVRQMSLFAAGWTIGSIRNLAFAGATWLTYYETTGWRGLMERTAEAESILPFLQLAGAVFPLYHVFADLAEFIGGELLALESSEDGVLEALALRKETRFLLLLANVTDTSQFIRLELPTLPQLRMRVLDETTAERALFESEKFRQGTRQDLAYSNGGLQMELRPYAIMRIDGTIKDE